jgi:hypothetical protein
MSILVIIVLIVGMVFQRASVAWETGMRRADMNMTGRAVADFMAQEMSRAVLSSNDSFTASGASATFWILGDAESAARRAVREIGYSQNGGGITRTDSGSAAEMCADVPGLVLEFEEGPRASTAELPVYVDIRVTVSDGGAPSLDVVYQARAFFPNRNRYRF